MSRWRKIGAAWAIELVVLFIVAEIVSVFFLPAPLRFYHPQMLMQSNSRRIYDHEPNQRAFTIDQPFVTNSMGFRDEREVPANKDGEFRILSLGDSLAVGLGVSQEDTYARRLEALLRPRYGAVRVINAGVGCYSTWQEVDLLKEKGVKVQPDIVMLEFFWNDLYVRPASVAPLSSSYTGDPPLWQYVRWLKRSRVLSYLRERFEIVWFKMFPSFDWAHQQMIYEGRTSPYLEQAYSDVAASLEEFASLARIHRFVPILIVFPMPGQVRRPDAATHMQRRMEAIARRVGLPTFDLLPTLHQWYPATRDIYIPWDNTHLSPRGHELVAKVLEQYLDENHLVSPHVAGRLRTHRMENGRHEEESAAIGSVVSNEAYGTRQK